MTGCSAQSYPRGAPPHPEASCDRLQSLARRPHRRFAPPAGGTDSSRPVGRIAGLQDRTGESVIQNPRTGSFPDRTRLRHGPEPPVRGAGGSAGQTILMQYCRVQRRTHPMATTTINTLRFARRSKDTGVPAAQVERWPRQSSP